jgi:hypothetical protein
MKEVNMGERRFTAVHDYEGGKRYNMFESLRDRNAYIEAHEDWRKPTLNEQRRLTDNRKYGSNHYGKYY